MRTRPFRTVLEAALAEAGTPYTSATQGQLEVAANAVSFRSQTLADMFPWPELLLVEERAFAENYFASKTYEAGDVVWYDTTRKYYEALQGTTGNLPTDATYWEETTRPDPQVIEVEQYGANKIDRLWSVWTNDPRSALSNRSWDFTNMGDRYDVPRADSDTVWIVFHKPPARYTAIVWDVNANYNRYDQVYYPGDENGVNFPDRGENYMLELDTNGNAMWVLVPFPAVLFGYCVYGAAASMVRYGGNHDLADILEARAEQSMQTEWDKARPLIKALVKGVGT